MEPVISRYEGSRGGKTRLRDDEKGVLNQEKELRIDRVENKLNVLIASTTYPAGPSSLQSPLPIAQSLHLSPSVRE